MTALALAGVVAHHVSAGVLHQVNTCTFSASNAEGVEASITLIPGRAIVSMNRPEALAGLNPVHIEQMRRLSGTSFYATAEQLDDLLNTLAE